ncbi:MAG: DUF4198 domain-containing protein [Alphaproteobacteria bacterium]|nr:DUF4198 domain-containing protein [Alphaproteobacteria bacterium]MBU2271875.1 DUF4198 domain-containing protein [Alphaproteobacteria bacterium]MBU2419885.1 DUF4198 domain-containing protein [Alphaproteobacteria bacterium]
MKKPLAILAALATLALPMSAQAHRAWLAPTSTVLSGTDAWVGFDAAMSNGVFIADHAAMNLAGLVITAPDGSTAEAENMMRARYRSTFDLHLTQPGTYRVANVMGGLMVSYKQGGETKRWRGAEAEMAANIPADATEVTVTRSDSRIETFVTLGAPTTDALQPTGQGIELAPVSHPNDLVAGEAATFKLLRDGQPAADLEVTIARGGTRYRDNPDEMTVRTDADGAFTVTWPEPGMYWVNASVRTPAADGRPGASAQYNGVMEVLP